MFTIDDLINALNQVEVKGKENLDKLLSVIVALEFIREAQNKPSENTPSENPTGEGE